MKTNNQNELLNIVVPYVKNAKLIGKIVSLYASPEMQDARLFYSHKILTFTVYRGLSLLHELLSLQIILKKPIYLPGVGLFRPVGKVYEAEYNFDEIFPLIPFLERDFGEKRFTNKVLVDGKIDYELFDQTLGQFHKKKGSRQFSPYSKNLTKMEKLNESIIDKFGNVRVEIVEPYAGELDFESIVRDAEKHSETIRSYLSSVNLSKIAFNETILEDMLYIIGYISAVSSRSTEMTTKKVVAK